MRYQGHKFTNGSSPHCMNVLDDLKTYQRPAQQNLGNIDITREPATGSGCFGN